MMVYVYGFTILVISVLPSVNECPDPFVVPEPLCSHFICNLLNTSDVAMALGFGVRLWRVLKEL